MEGDRHSPDFEKRFFIPISGFLLEVSHKDYLEHYRDKNRQDYLRKEALRVGEASLDAMIDMDAEIPGDMRDDVADSVIDSMMSDFLRTAITRLDEDEQALINMLCFDGQTESHCAEVLGVSLVTVYSRKKRVLQKLKKIFS